MTMTSGKPSLQALPANEMALLRQSAEQLRQEAEAQGIQREAPLRLEIGEPNFPTPEHIVQAAIASLREEGQTYGPPCGWPWLRQLLAEKIARVNGYRVSPANIAITVGGTGAVQLALLATVGEGDEVLLPDPGWPHYYRQLAVAGAWAVPYHLDPSNGWLPDPQELERLLTPRTRLLIVNSPSNPTGAVYPPPLLAELLAFARRHRLYLLSDECYDEIVFEGRHVSPGSLLTPAELDEARFIGVYSFSKTYAMTGWRLGYLVAGSRLLQTLTQVLDASYTSLPTALQRAAAAALSGPQDCVTQMRAAYRRRRDLAIALLKSYERYDYTPHGAFYLLVKVTGPAHRDASSFAFELLRSHNVLVAPGSLFGSLAANYVRISLGAAEEEIERGLRAICELASLSRHPHL
jgi:aspartate aminotransferase